MKLHAEGVICFIFDHGVVVPPALARGVMLDVSRCKVPTSAVMPILVSRILNSASAEASRISHAVTRSIPPPMQWLWIAAMTGTGQLATDVMAA